MIWPMPGDKVFQNQDNTKYLRRLAMTSNADIPNLPTIDEAAPGSTAFSVGESQVYMLEPVSGEWRAI